MAELESIAVRVAARLIERGETIAVAESSAGGLVAAALLAVPGASSYFLGGAVVYTATARQALLAIIPEMMTGMRPASEPYALLLARVSRERFGATWGLAETGAAGPTGNRYLHRRQRPSRARRYARNRVTGSSRQHGGFRGRGAWIARERA